MTTVTINGVVLPIESEWQFPASLTLDELERLVRGLRACLRSDDDGDPVLSTDDLDALWDSFFEDGDTTVRDPSRKTTYHLGDLMFDFTIEARRLSSQEG